MNISINENSKLLRFYTVLSCILGGLLLFWGGLMLCRFLFLSIAWQSNPITIAVAVENFHGGIYRFVIPGIIALWIGQFIKYITKQIDKPTWILQFGTKAFYVLIFFVILNFIIGICLYALINSGQIILPEGAVTIPPAGSSFLTWAEFIFPKLLCCIVYIFILYGLAQIQKCTMPIIRESKTLV